MDDSRLVKGSPAESQYEQALQLGQPSDTQALLQHVRQWLSAEHKLDAASIAVAYAPARQPRRLHINFSSLAGLAAALLACPFLVRCGTLLSGSAWGGAAPCGDVKRHQLPELLQLSCIPSMSQSRTLSQLLNSDAVELLKEMQLDYTTWWPASSMSTRGKGHPTNSNQPPERIVLLVLPRSILTLPADIERLHGRHSLWGGKVRVQGVNQQSLRRCTQCDEIGHDSSRCAKYAGLALRLLFKQPLPYTAMQSIQQSAQAKLAFLGSSVDEMQPSRRLTLLFDAQEDDAEKVEEILSRLAPIIHDLGPALHQAPDVVNTKNRQRECRECGWMPPHGQPASTHCCPFSMQQGPLQFRPQQRAAAAGKSTDAEQASSTVRAFDARASSDSSNGVCLSWRRTGTCPRLNKEQRCGFSHPDSMEQPSKGCFEWERTGVCSRGLVCRFSASHKPELAGQQKRAAPAASAKEAESSDSSAAPISAPASSQQQESKQQEESKSMEIDTQAAESTAAAAPPASPPSARSAAASSAAPVSNRKRGRPSRAALAAEQAAAEEQAAEASETETAAEASASNKVASSSSSSSWADEHFSASAEELDECDRRRESTSSLRKSAVSKHAAAAAAPIKVSSLSSLGMSAPPRAKVTLAAAAAATAELASPAKKAKASSRASSDAAASSAASASITGSSRSSSSSSHSSPHRGR